MIHGHDVTHMRTVYVFELGCELSQTKRKEKFVDSEVDLLFSFITCRSAR